MDVKKTPDKAQIPLEDAKLEEASGGSTATGLLRDNRWICPGCKVIYDKKQSRCPKCGYES